MLFALFLTIYTDTGTQVYVEDYNLTASDCTTAMLAYNESDPTWARGVPSCEFDHAALDAVFVHNGESITLPPCEYEDSNNCYWDAESRGNGEGYSFYVVNGEVMYFLHSAL